MDERDPRRNNRGGFWFTVCCDSGLPKAFMLFGSIMLIMLLALILAGNDAPIVFTTSILFSSATTTTTTPTASSTTPTASSTTTSTTTTTPTTTTTAAPTAPSAFSIFCNSSAVTLGDVEYNGPPDFYTVTGTGCGGSNITVTVQSESIQYNRRRHVPPVKAGKRSMMTIHNNVTAVNITTTPTTISGVNTTLTMQEACDLYNLTVAAAGSMHKRDLFTYPLPKFERSVPVVGVTQTNNLQNPAEELIVSSDMGPNYYLETNNMAGALLYYMSSQDYLTGFGALFIHAIMQPQCVGGMGSAPTVPAGVRFDREAGRFVVATLNQFTGTICFSFSSTENPLGSWTAYALGPDFTNFVYPNNEGFEFNIWSDTYSLCNGVTCIVFNRAVMLLSQPAEYVILDRSTLFPTQPMGYPLPPMHATNQDRDAPRTSFMTVDAPCGVFSTIEAATGTLEVRLCQSIDYMTGMATFQSLSMTVTGGSWASSVGQPCDCATLLSVNKNTYSNHVQSAYDKRGRMAWAWTSGAGSPTTSIAWAEMDTTTLVVSSPTQITRGALLTPPLTSVSGGNYYFSPKLLYDCYGTLFMSLSAGTSDDNILIPRTTYRLRSDPEGVMRTPADSTSPLGTQFDTTTYPSSWGFPNMVLSTYTGVPRPVHILQAINNGEVGARIHVARQTHNVTYIAQDACFTTSTCQQTIELLTNGTCVSA